MSRSRAVGVLCLVLVGCNSSPSEPTRSSPVPVPARAPTTTPEPKALDVVELTTGEASKDAPLPLVVALHGLGDRPEVAEVARSGAP